LPTSAVEFVCFEKNNKARTWEIDQMCWWCRTLYEQHENQWMVILSIKPSMDNMINNRLSSHTKKNVAEKTTTIIINHFHLLRLPL
jgi:hypothetical protein